jgi:hypothetical protein
MRIYVAAKYAPEPILRAREVMAQLIMVGHVITYNWTTNEQVNAQQARYDMEGVLSAHALVLIAEQDLRYTGMLVEFGMALGAGIPVYVLGDALDDRCIFMKLPHIHRGIDVLLGRGHLHTVASQPPFARSRDTVEG